MGLHCKKYRGDSIRATKLEVNLDQFNKNINQIKEYTHKEIMPVIKANAYGTYINQRIDVLEQFQIVAVALVDEGIELRNKGYKGDIFILNQPSIKEIDEIIKWNLTIGLCCREFLDDCIEKQAKLKVHLEIETGMNRTGINIKNLNEFLNAIQQSNIIIEGIYSHFSSADFDEDYTQKQIKVFEEALDLCRQRSIEYKYIHISASSGILNYNLPFTNLVRPGIMIYGYEPYQNGLKELKIRPICNLTSEISFIKEVEPGTKIGYSQKYTCNKETIVATIPIGYGDGLRRELFEKGRVYINGKFAPIIGTICMDNIMVDITGINANVEDKVIIFDNENIKLEEISEKCNTINYEILCTISNRVPRIFIKNE